VVGFLFGHALCGRWASVDGEGVCTKFFILGVPIFPVDALYVVGNPVRPKRTLPARWSKRSIVLAYLRWVIGPIVVVATWLATAVDAGVGPQPIGGQHPVAMLGVVAGWLALVFLSGRTHGRQVAQRRLMKRYLGHAAPPELLTEAAARAELERLEQMWTALAAKDSPYREGEASQPWRDAFPKDVRNSVIPLFYALCRYDAAISGDEIRENRARLAWERIEPSA
jgi:hypothetical protein